MYDVRMSTGDNVNRARVTPHLSPAPSGQRLRTLHMREVKRSQALGTDEHHGTCGYTSTTIFQPDPVVPTSILVDAPNFVSIA